MKEDHIKTRLERLEYMVVFLKKLQLYTAFCLA